MDAQHNAQHSHGAPLATPAHVREFSSPHKPIDFQRFQQAGAAVICLNGENNMLFCGLVDHTIRVCNVMNGELIRVLTGHKDWVRTLCLAGNKLLSGSDDRTVRIWDLQSWEAICTVQVGAVTCLQVHDNTIFAGSDDPFVFALSLGTRALVRRYEGHTGPINSLVVGDGVLYSTSGDCSARAWNIETGECVAVFRGHTYSVNCCLFIKNVLYTGSGDCTVRGVNILTEQTEVVFTGHSGPVFCLTAVENVVFSGSGDCSVRLWDLATRACLSVLEGHTDWVNALHIMDGVLYSGSVDTTIHSWNIQPVLVRARTSDASPLRIESPALSATSPLMTASNVPPMPLPHGSDEDTPNGVVLYSFGCDKDGQLGHGDCVERVIPTPIRSLDHVIVVIACGGGREESHSVAIAESGILLAWGSNSSGQLGLGDTNARSQPCVVHSLREHSCRRVACGAAHTVALTTEGKAFCFGWGKYGQLGLGDEHSFSRPQWVEKLASVPVSGIACGSAHSVCFSDSGEVYSWGWGMNGQLGHGDTSNHNVPKLVSALSGYSTSQVATGLAHTLALCDYDRSVYSWGWDEYGQLGQGKSVMSSTKNRVPRPISALQGKGVTLVVCGGSHSLAVTDTGDTYVWGCGKDGQLGLGQWATSKNTPTLLKSLQGRGVYQVAACVSHTLALTENGDLYSWGNNNCGQLGIGDKSNQHTPCLNSYLRGQNVVGLACSGGMAEGHSLVLTNSDPNSRSDVAVTVVEANTHVPLVPSAQPSPARVRSHEAPAQSNEPRQRLAASVQFSKSVVTETKDRLQQQVSYALNLSSGDLAQTKKAIIEERRAVAATNAQLRKELSEVQAKQSIAAKQENYEEAERFAALIERIRGQLSDNHKTGIALAEKFFDLEAQQNAHRKAECTARRQAAVRFADLQAELLARSEECQGEAAAAFSRRGQSLASQQSQLEASQETCDNQLSSLTEEEESLAVKFDAETQSAREERDNMQTSIAMLRTERDEIEKQIEELKRQLEFKQNQEAVCESALETANATLSSLEEKFHAEVLERASVRKEVENQKQTVVAQMERVSTQKRILEEDEKNMEAANTEHQSLVQMINDTAEENQEALTKAEEYLAMIQDYQEQRKHLMLDDNPGFAEPVHSKEVDLLREKVASNKSAIRDLSYSVLRLNSDLAKARSSVAAIDASLQELQVKKDIAAAAREFKEAAQLSGQMKTLQASRDQASSLLERLLPELQATQAPLEQAKAELVASDKQLEAAEVQADNQRMQVFQKRARALQQLVQRAIELQDYDGADLINAELEALNAQTEEIHNTTPKTSSNDLIEFEAPSPVTSDPAGGLSLLDMIPSPQPSQGKAEEIDALEAELQEAVLREDYDTAEEINTRIAKLKETS